MQIGSDGVYTQRRGAEHEGRSFEDNGGVATADEVSCAPRPEEIFGHPEEYVRVFNKGQGGCGGVVYRSVVMEVVHVVVNVIIVIIVVDIIFFVAAGFSNTSVGSTRRSGCHFLCIFISFLISFVNSIKICGLIVL